MGVPSMPSAARLSMSVMARSSGKWINILRTVQYKIYHLCFCITIFSCTDSQWFIMFIFSAVGVQLWSAMGAASATWVRYAIDLALFRVTLLCWKSYSTKGILLCLYVLLLYIYVFCTSFDEICIKFTWPTMFRWLTQSYTRQRPAPLHMHWPIVSG